MTRRLYRASLAHPRGSNGDRSISMEGVCRCRFYLPLAMFFLALAYYCVLVPDDNRSKNPPPLSPASIESASSLSEIVSDSHEQKNEDEKNTSLKLNQEKPEILPLDPIRYLIDNVEAFAQFPSTIKGIVLLFHGCNHDGIDWFLLPEERTIVNFLLEKYSFGVVSFSSQRRSGSRCWSSTWPADKNADAVKVSAVLPLILQRQGINQEQQQSLPVYGIGASSGGRFVTIAHSMIPLAGMEVIVSSGHPLAIESILATASPGKQPRMAFVEMARASQKSLDAIQENLPKFHAAVSHTPQPKPVTASWLSDRIDLLSKEQSSALVTKLETDNQVGPIISASTGDLLQDPRRVWKRIETILLVELGMDQNMVMSLQEELNLAYAQHELTSEYLESVMEFLVA